jgi:hypothetical protein
MEALTTDTQRLSRWLRFAVNAIRLRGHQSLTGELRPMMRSADMHSGRAGPVPCTPRSSAELSHEAEPRGETFGLGAPATSWRHAAIVGIKIVHTAAFFSIGSCLVYLAYSGLREQSDRRAVVAGAVVTGEALINAANGFRCPLTDLAEKLGSARGSVVDIYLPTWLETLLPFITGPIFAGALFLHARNLLRERGRALREATNAPD